MNHLAHIFLSFQEKELLVGNFIADYVTNKQLLSFSEDIQRGIVLHRKIDHYTDNHPEVKKGVRRLYPYHGKYAAVVIDIYYDYLLANHWDEYCSIALEEFTSGIYDTLKQYIAVMPARLQQSLPIMIEHDWLFQYKNREGMERAFSGLKRRTSRPELLNGVVDNLFLMLPELTKEFIQFFPEVIEFSKENH